MDGTASTDTCTSGSVYGFLRPATSTLPESIARTGVPLAVGMSIPR